MPLRVHVAFLTAIALSSVLALVVIAAELRPDRTATAPTLALRYDIDAVVDRDGTMRVEERFRYEFDKDRVRLMRFFPATETLPTDWEVLRDGEPEPFAITPEGSGHLLVVGGDRGAEGDGVHEYLFRYRVASVLPDGSGGARPFAEQLISPRYAVRVRAGRVRVRFPTEVQSASCFFGDGAPCRVAGVGTRRLTVALEAMPPRTGLLLSAATVLAAAPSVPVPLESPNPGSPSP